MEKLLIVLSTLLFLCVSVDKVNGQQTFKTTTESVIAYLEYLPEGYSTNSDKYPVVFFLHGVGERGPNSTDPAILGQYIQNVAKHGPPKHAKSGTKFPFILISPQLKNNYGDWPTSYIEEVINHCKSYLRIDERRIYLTGLSLGGGGTWWAAQDLPAFFAAIAPVCGSRNSTSKACGIASENLPVWAFHGDKDATVPLSRSQYMVNAINACVPKPSPLAKLTVYPGVGHNSWDNAFLPDNTIHTPNVYEWLLGFTNTINKGNAIPVASAGADKTISTLTTTLTGTGADTDGSIVSYNWKKVSGPAASLTNGGTAVLSLSGLQLGTYLFSLTVTDNTGNTDTDYIALNVVEAVNVKPVAKAGPDKAITLPVNTFVVYGAGVDSDGTVVSYAWTKIAGGDAVLSSANTPTLGLSGLTQGSFTFRLTVKDDDGASHYNDMVLKVNPPIVPVVNAGADKLVKLPTTSATIFGSATDGDGTVSAYSWTKILGGSCTMNNSTTSTLKLGGLASGTYVFRLTARDNHGYYGSDDITVTVDAPPVVNAGSDRTITLPMSTSLSLSGQASDPDGTVVKYQWSKYSGPNATLSGSATPSLTISQLYEGTYVFKLAATDNYGVQGIDYITVQVKASTITSSNSSVSSSSY